jgi:ABC-type sugar transport system substrate-binding protein/DNA-binding response OmpR family regulator/nitrogen-specific signal transduction histidine kinase
MDKIVIIIATIVILFNFSSCTKQNETFVIGVSQCSEDLWRETVNKEIRREASFRNNMEVIIKSVKDDSEQQIKDIELFIEEDIDLLIVAPNEANALTPVVSKAYQSGIPVILLDRRILNEDYTAYVGADNYYLAYQLGLYSAAYLNYKGNVVEIRGLKGSTADIERNRGFSDALKQYPEIQIIDQEYCNFLRPNAREAMLEIIDRHKDVKIDLVFAMNDQMAMGVNDAYKNQNLFNRPFIVGVDALIGEGGGIEAINNGSIDASFIYPTGGDMVIEVAYKILNGIEYDRENILSTGVIDKSNVRVISLQNQQIIAQQKNVDILNSRLRSSIILYSKQKQFFYYSLTLSIFALIVLSVLIKTNRSKNSLNKKLNKQNEDITKQVDKLQQQKMQLINLSKELETATQAKLVFFTNISHDFKTPLTLIMGPVEELLSSDNFTQDQIDSLKIVQRNSYKLMGLITQILEFRTYENGKMALNYSVGALDTFLENINQLFSKFILQKQISFSFSTDNENYTIPFDPEKLEKIYFNILSNAFKFVLPGGKINVTLNQVSSGRKKYFQLSVYNSDSYIPQDKVKNIFDRFYHMGGMHESSGIGLALTKSLVQLHKGTIKVESTQNEGTTFIVTIPKVDIIDTCVESSGENLLSDYSRQQITSMDIPLIEKDGFDEITNKDKATVLLIDDNNDICAYVRSILSNDYNVLVATCGDEGIKKAIKFLPDIIISDIMMPGGIGGFEVCRRLKATDVTKDIPIIILTALSMDDQRIKGYESGADAYLSKPFNADVIKIRIKKLIEKQKSINKLLENEWIIGESKKTLADSHQEILNDFRKYVEDHIHEEINIDDIAAYMNMSRSKFYRQLKEITDYSPTDIINMIKLKIATHMMTYEHKTISEAAFASGFSSSSYFTKTFTKFYKQRPSDYVKSKSAGGPH